MNNTIKCQLCGLECHMQITASHLRAVHNLTTKEYRALGYKTLSPARLKQLRSSSLAKGDVRRRYGSDHHAFKSGCVTKIGYRVVCDAGRHVYEHRLMMEQHLGRRLRRNEVIHHINGIRHDNRLENLQLMSPIEHGRLPNRSLKDSLWPRAQRLLDRGLPGRRIASQLGISPSTLYRWKKRFDYHPSK